jgi:hypothetical protein
LAKLIDGSNISEAWLLALGHLLEVGGVDVNLAVSAATPTEDPRIRGTLDQFIGEHHGRRSREVWPVMTVANTLFPQAYYRPNLGPSARERLYALNEESQRVHRRVESESYFDRLVRWPGLKGEVNQLERLVEQLTRKFERGGALGGTSELATSHPLDGPAFVADLRVQAPGKDRQ